MQAQDLHIRDPQAGALDGREHLRQGRYIAAGKDVFGDEGFGDARLVLPRDGVDHSHPVLAQQAGDGGEIGRVLGFAHVFEHAHRHDAVERTLDIAIVAQLEPHSVRQSARLSPAARDGQLLLGERNAKDGRARRLFR